MSSTKPQVHSYSVVNKKSLSPDEADLHELCLLAGIVFDQQVFKIIMDLLHLNVAPTAIERVLKSMTSQQQKKRPTSSAEGTHQGIPTGSRLRQPAGGARNRSAPR